MGMDVYGKNGSYFRNNVWWWQPLWNYCCEVGSNVIPDKVRASGHSNDGAGLNWADSIKLSEILLHQIESGKTKKYEDEYTAKIEALPDEDCTICGGTGLRAEVPNIGPGKLSCNGCNRTGKCRPWSASYPFSVENVKAFAEFLLTCGGFEIC